MYLLQPGLAVYRDEDSIQLNNHVENLRRVNYLVNPLTSSSLLCMEPNYMLCHLGASLSDVLVALVGLEVGEIVRCVQADTDD